MNPGNAPFSWVAVLSAFGAFSGLLGSILVLLCTDTARFARRHEAGKVAALTSLIGATVPVIATTLFGIYLLRVPVARCRIPVSRWFASSARLACS